MRKFILGLSAALAASCLAVSESSAATGLAGAYYYVGPEDMLTTGDALGRIAGLEPSATFTAHSLCFPACGEVIDDSAMLSEFLGVASGKVTNLSNDFAGLDHHVMVLTGFMNVPDGGYQFALGSDDGSWMEFFSLYFGFDEPQAYREVLSGFVYLAAGSYPITIVQWENRGDTGLTVMDAFYGPEYREFWTEFPSAVWSHTPVIVDPGPVPEPATWLMAILGFGAIGSELRRRTRRAPSGRRGGEAIGGPLKTL